MNSTFLPHSFHGCKYIHSRPIFMTAWVEKFRPIFPRNVGERGARLNPIRCEILRRPPALRRLVPIVRLAYLAGISRQFHTGLGLNIHCCYVGSRASPVRMSRVVYGMWKPVPYEMELRNFEIYSICYMAVQLKKKSMWHGSRIF